MEKENINENKGQNERFFVKMEKQKNINEDKGQNGRFFIKMKKNIDEMKDSRVGQNGERGEYQGRNGRFSLGRQRDEDSSEKIKGVGGLSVEVGERCWRATRHK